MTTISFEQILEHVRAADSAYHKLVVLAAPSRNGKTKALRAVSESLNLPLVNFSLLMSQKLLGLTRRQRALQAEEIARNVLDDYEGSALCLDNTELMFDPGLRLDPLQLLQDLSRSRLLAATWNGSFQGGDLTAAYIGHPEYFRRTATGFPVVTVSQGQFELHLTT